MLNIIGIIVILGVVLLGLGVFGSLLSDEKIEKIAMILAVTGACMIVFPLLISLNICFMM